MSKPGPRQPQAKNSGPKAGADPQPPGAILTSNQGVPINDDQNTLTAGARGPALLEDFLLREKITHFDHERIPERVVHARGSAAHGQFQVYECEAELTRAAFLQDPAAITPVFVRFSTVAGSRGSSDLARDARGFAVKFYTTEGNYDLVGNNMPVFFIQDAIKFPDLIHAVKPAPDSEIPQASSAHDSFWDFVSLAPESMHMLMWLMSDRALPRSLRMMEGFGVHSFRFVTAEGVSSFVKFHWKPLLGVHSLIWPEAQALSGQDPDFHRRDLWEAINDGEFPEWELGVQVVAEADEHRFPFDLLDATKLIPEELVPVRRIGKLTLNRNVDNFFAETEQVAFHAGHVVPGIDFSNDPLLAGRLFSYTDTQLLRLGGPNFHELPVNRARSPVANHQRDGLHRQRIDTGSVAYSPNSLGNGCPMQATRADGGYVSHPEPVSGHKQRGRSPKFFDHFGQAAMFFNSLAPWEQEHIVKALQFELGKLHSPVVVQRMLGLLHATDIPLACKVAEGLGVTIDAAVTPLNRVLPASDRSGDYEPVGVNPYAPSPALSMANRPSQGIPTRRIALLAADGVDLDCVYAMQDALLAAGARSRIVAPRGGRLTGLDGRSLKIDHSLLTTGSVIFDAVFVPGGEASIRELLRHSGAVHFIHEAYWHFKTIGGHGEGCDLISAAGVNAVFEDSEEQDPGVVMSRSADVVELAADFIDAVAQHRHWLREARALARA